MSAIRQSCLHLSLCSLFLSASASAQEPGPAGAPVSPRATAETRALLGFLRGHKAGTLLGSQVNYKTPNQGPPMVRAIGGKDPVVIGWDIASLRPEKASTFDGPLLPTVKSDVENAFAAGQIVCFADHMNNFLTGGNWYDRANACMREIAPGGTRHEDFRRYLDDMAGFFDSLSVGGRKVPVILRLFHEAKLAAFWWSNYKGLDQHGRPWVQAADYIASYRFAIQHLASRCDNLLFVYCQGVANGGETPDEGMPKAWYQEIFPGADVCDLIGVDCYANGSPPFPGQMDHKWMVAAYDAAAELSLIHDKPFVMPEFGFAYSAQRWGEQGEAGGFWTGTFLPQLRARPVQPVYMMLWTGKFAPAVGARTQADAALFFQDPTVKMAGDLPRRLIYGF